jgi:hypothetical protein
MRRAACRRRRRPGRTCGLLAAGGRRHRGRELEVLEPWREGCGGQERRGWAGAAQQRGMLVRWGGAPTFALRGGAVRPAQADGPGPDLLRGASCCRAQQRGERRHRGTAAGGEASWRRPGPPRIRGLEVELVSSAPGRGTARAIVAGTPLMPRPGWLGCTSCKLSSWCWEVCAECSACAPFGPASGAGCAGETGGA